jgi:DNA topoisomerase-1
MPLVLIESPNKVSKLKEILGDKYKIMASVGHIMDLSKKDLGIIDLETFEVAYKPNADKKDVISNIKNEVKKHEVIYLATDPDREGEAIAFHLSKLIPDGKTIHRVKFNAITKDVVLKAIKKPGLLDENLFLAQKARRITDRVVGFKVSPVMWNKGLIGTSAGRVQSVALKYISDREKEIRSFKSEEYWNIISLFKEDFDADVYAKNGKTIDLKNETDAKSIEKLIREASEIKVTEVIAKSRSRKPYPPFTTSTLQQSASSAFGWSAKKTMDVAQAIFSQGLITYHRTDSVRVDPAKIDDLRDKIESQYGKKYLSSAIIKYGAKDGAQDAHEAIRPTYEQPLSTLSKDENKLLALIESRFMASQMSDAQFDQLSIKIEATNGKTIINMKKNGSTMKFDGFLKVYGDKQDDVTLPSLAKNQSLYIKDVKLSQHFTKPKPRHTDASIVKILEGDGVGRPSTYASILDTLFERDYITRNGNSLSATEVGIMVSDYLSDNFPKIVDPKFTSNMEEKLDKIAEGTGIYKDILSDFYVDIETQTNGALKGTLPKSFVVDVECPKCKSSMTKKISKHGAFLGCIKWPECNGVKNIDGSTSDDKNIETGHKCPECSNIMMLREGKKGKFFGCKSYPECKTTASVSDDGSPVFAEKKDDADAVICQKCKKGKMIQRSGKFGKFLGCSNFPKCKNILK